MNKNIGETILCHTEDIAKEYSEMALDYFLDEGLLKDIPVIGSISSVLKTGSSIRDALFCKKLTTFLCNINDIPREKRKEFNDKALKDDKEFSEKLIFILDRIDESKKAEYLAKLYKGYCEDVFSYNEFRKCCIALTQIYLGDMNYLIKTRISGSIGFTFTSLGLYESSISEKVNDVIRVGDFESFKQTNLGKKMSKCIFY